MSISSTEKRFIGLAPETLKQAGADPALNITAAWFGFRTTVDQVPEHCPVEVAGRSQFKLYVNGESLLFGSSLQSNGLTQARFPSREVQIIPVFALCFALMLEDYVEQTGDLDFVRPYVPVAERVVETFLGKRCQSGMIAPQGYWDYFDWTKEWDGQFATPMAVLDGESALQNLFFVYAVQNFCRLLPKFHRADLAVEYQRECDTILSLVEKTCFVPERGLYKEGPRTEEYSQHTQIYAVLTGLASGDKAKAIMGKVLEDKSLVQCSFMQKFYLFRALEQVGMYDRTGELWQAWYDFIDLHCTTFPETPFAPRSDCHAWSALPLYEFAKRNEL